MCTLPAEFEAQARQQTKRLDALWRIVNTAGLHGDELLLAMLREAALAMHPGRAFGSLGHLEGPEYVLDAFADFAPSENSPPLGMRTPRSEMLQVRDLGAARTQTWDDCQALPDLPDRPRRAGLRRQITTQFEAAGALHVLTVGSRDAPPDTPISADDVAYIELLASFFARHLEHEHLQRSLIAAEVRTRRHAERLEALWQMANNPSLRGEALMFAMLQQGAAAIRPGQRFRGQLGRIEGDTVLVISVGTDASDDRSNASRLQVGQRKILSQTIIPRVHRTQAFEDLATMPAPPPAVALLGWRAAISTRFDAGGSHYVLTFSSQEPATMPFSENDLAFIDVLASSFANQLEVDRLESSLGDEEQRSRQHAERLEALWQIANNPTLQGEALVLAMLRKAAAAMRPNQRFRGQLGRIEGDVLILIAIGSDTSEGNARPGRIAVGGAKPLEQTIFPLLTRTHAWDDLAALDEPPVVVANLGWRAVISTLFEAAGSRYILSFSSNEPAAIPFNANDLTYIDVIATAFANQLAVAQLEESLRDEEERSRQHAERLEALWQIANNPTLRGEELTFAMLRQAAAAIRPGQLFRGVLGRIEGDEAVIVAVGVRPDDDDPRAQLVWPGRRTRLQQTIIPRVGQTQAFEDLQTAGELSANHQRLGWRATVTTQFEAGGSRYSLTFASPEPATTPFSAADLAYVDTVASSFAKQLELNRLEDSLRDEEEQSRHHAERLEALWKIVNDPGLKDQELQLAMLRQAAAALRTNQTFRGMLWRVAGTDMVVEALAHYPHAGPALHTQVGDVVPLAGTVAGHVLADGGGTRSWNDIQTSAEASQIAVRHDTHAMIVTTFTAGATTWGLLFASNEPALTPLGPQDHTYVEVIASFFANHVQQRWQFERIQYQQSHDVLTGLLNRSQFRSQARAAARTSAHYAIVLVNVDAFREINETYGNMIGDAILVEVGNALRQRAGEDEIVGRIGGNIFGIFIPQATTKEIVRSRVRNFAEAFAQPFSTGDREGKEFISRTASFGTAVAPDDGTILDEILSHADSALVDAKKRGQGSIVVYEPGMEGDAVRRAALRNELADAVAKDQFVLHFQPHIEIGTGNVSGCEVLIRWNHPTRGLLLPGEFIPFAEQSGIITSIDQWVMQNTFTAAKELNECTPDFRIYFNLSGRQAGDPHLIRAFVNAARSGVALEHLGVEITESDAMRDVEATRHVCRALRRLNVMIAIDDFGTGYSSLSSLKRLPVDIVKIDRSFISGVLTDPHDATIADTIISIAARFGFDSLAEGVERLGEVGWLRSRPCRYGQGYAICHPLPLYAFKQWLAGHES
jgi:diguanylate cyclase (GGDEF)-like protein